MTGNQVKGTIMLVLVIGLLISIAHTLAKISLSTHKREKTLRHLETLATAEPPETSRLSRLAEKVTNKTVSISVEHVKIETNGLVPYVTTNIYYVFDADVPENTNQYVTFYVEVPRPGGAFKLAIERQRHDRMAKSGLERICALTALGTTVWTEEEWTNSTFLRGLTNVTDLGRR